MRRLTLVGAARLHVVVRTDGNVELFVPIAVEIPESQIEGAVRICFPPVERRRHILAGPERGLAQDGVRHNRRGNRAHNAGR